MLLAVTEDDLRSEIARGENTGLTLSHRAVVRHLSTLGGFRPGKTGSFSTETRLPSAREWRPASLRAVVFAKGRTSRRVLGASSLRLSQ